MLLKQNDKTNEDLIHLNKMVVSLGTMRKTALSNTTLRLLFKEGPSTIIGTV